MHGILYLEALQWGQALSGGLWEKAEGDMVSVICN